MKVSFQTGFLTIVVTVAHLLLISLLSIQSELVEDLASHREMPDATEQALQPASEAPALTKVAPDEPAAEEPVAREPVDLPALPMPRMKALPES